MRASIFHLSLVLLSFSCTEKQGIPKTISLMTTITTQRNGKRITQDSISILNTKFFEIGLYKIDSNSYHAEIGMEKPKTPDNFRVSYLRIINQDSTILPFQSPAEFLEFMSSRGYVMIHQRKLDLCSDYIFTKIN